MDRSNGFLPLAPLRHAEPTAVGVWDMERAEVVRPLQLPADGARDQLVLVRLHGQPLTIVHLDQPPGAETRRGLLAAVWRTASDTIIRHVTDCRCMPAPDGSEELSAMLDADRADCPRRTPSRAPGRAAVIVCTTGAQPDALARCLGSLAEMRAANFEVVVVDNRPGEGRTRALVENVVSRAGIRWVGEPRAGLARARNTGVAAARDAAYVAFTDDDVIVDPDWLSALLEPFADSEVQAATGLVLPLHLRSRAEKRFEHYAGFGKGVSAEIYDLGEHAANDRFLYPYWGGMFGSGNSMAFRREALSAVGGFDPALGAGTPTAGGEDLAAFTDVILAGGRLAYEPRSLCWHEHRGDEQALRSQVRNYGIGLTAVLWRYFTRDPRFSAAAARSLPAMVSLARSRGNARERDAMPADLSRLELQGRLLGPWRYVRSSRAARLATDAEAARQMTGERPQVTRSGDAGPFPSERRPEPDQAGVQTRT